MAPRFTVLFLEEARNFIDQLEEDTRRKILYTLWRATLQNDRERFKKLHHDIWEFRTLHRGSHFRLFAFWDKEQGSGALVVCTHGMIKKTGKTPQREIARAVTLKTQYMNEKKQ